MITESYGHLLDDAWSVDVCNPVNFTHALGKGLLAWWLYLPQLCAGGTRWVSLAGPTPGTLTTIANAPTATSGWKRGSIRKGGFGELRLDGTNDHVTFGTTDRLRPTTLTVCCWTWATAAPASDYAGIVTHNRFGQPEGWALYLDTTGKLTFQIGDATTSTNPVDPAVFTLGAWTHIAGTYDGVNARLYKNGLLLDTDARTTIAYEAAQQAALGTWSTVAATPYYTGFLDDVRVYSRPLSEKEISQVYHHSRLWYPDLLNRFPLPTGKAAAVAGRTTKNTRSMGLGLQQGMGWQSHIGRVA